MNELDSVFARDLSHALSILDLGIPEPEAVRFAGFVAATAKPLGELAWAYFRGQDSRKARKPDFHMNAGLLKETDQDYPSAGKNSRDNRYLVISLSGEVLPNDHHGQLPSLDDWRCRYDLQNGTFDVPPDFLEHNAEAITPD